jgi:hypothetical protein
VRTCSDCGFELQDLTKPCPECGSIRQTAHVQPQPVTVAVNAHSPDISVGYGSDPAWYAQWRSVRQHLEVVEADFQPGAYPGNEPVRLHLENFFTQCFHLGDWLWQDKSTGLNEKQVRQFIDNDPALRVCAGMANTSKHRIRSRANALTARIASVASGPSATQASIAWSKGPDRGTEDALDLARRCVAAWEGYLKAQSLSSPI